MKKILLCILCIISLLFTGCEEKLDIDNMTIDEKVDYALKNMTLDKKIAQMLIVYYNSYDYDDTLSNVIKKLNPGGFILFNENIKNHNQLTDFINSMQKDSKIPMFISIDQEGGKVQRLYPREDLEVSYIPSMKEIGETNNPQEAYNIGKQIGKDLKRYGINVDFAPVVDINTNTNNGIGSRAFSDDANLVSQMGLELAKGLREEGIIPTFKHFPGHGSVETDSHYDLPVLNKTLGELMNWDLKPFINAIENNAEIIMIGHIAVPELDNNTPASLSKVVITDILRNQLGFNGLVVTDALNMGALTKNYSQEEIIINAIKAGVDLLLMPGSSKTTISTVKEAIENGKITEERINESVKRILNLKFANADNFKSYYQKLKESK